MFGAITMLISICIYTPTNICTTYDLDLSINFTCRRDSTACSTLREYAKKTSVNRRFAESAVALNLSLLSSMLFFPALALQFRTGGARGGSRTSEPEPQGPRMPRGSQESGRCSGAPLLGPSRRPPAPDFIFWA